MGGESSFVRGRWERQRDGMRTQREDGARRTRTGDEMEMKSWAVGGRERERDGGTVSVLLCTRWWFTHLSWWQNEEERLELFESGSNSTRMQFRLGSGSISRGDSGVDGGADGIAGEVHTVVSSTQAIQLDRAENHPTSSP